MKNLLLRCCTFTVLAILITTGNAQAQNWKQPMSDNTVTFYQIQSQFQHEMRFKERELLREKENEQAPGKNSSGEMMGDKDEAAAESYFQYKRWEDYMAPRVFPSGDLSLPSTTWDRYQEYLNTNPAAMQQYLQGQQNHSAQHYNGPNSTQSSTWTFAGPTGAPTGAGAGRVGFIRVDPTNVNNLWIGAPAGGLWKSTNGGASWSTNTDFLSVIGASDVVIDPTNTQNMYLATGDGDAGDTYSIGVMKSTDGGTTWNTTGLTWTVNQGRVIRKLLIMPGTPSTIMAFSNAGIWRTTNSGTSWTQVQSTNGFTDAEFMPGTPNTVYACGTTFWKSTDGGATWAQITTGVPATASVDRLAIAVTAAATATVYMIAGSAANDGFFGFYKSTNSGTSFTTVTVSSPSNLLGWASAGNDTGGQGWYDLVIDCSPSNANEVCVGGVNIWRTTNGGTSWTLNGHWTGTGAPYVHADHHAMVYVNATTMLEGCDGGIFKTTNNGTSWLDISANLCIAQIYRIGLSGQAGSPNYWITGHQDNGTNLKNGASYAGTMGGDGMDCFVDRTNNNVMYGEQYNGSHNRTTNGGGTWTAITTGLTGATAWVTPWYQDPTTANTIYSGRTNLWKSTNQGTAWTQLTALPGTGTIVDFKVAPSSNLTIYVVRSNAVYKTTNGGTSWTTVTGTLPVGSAAISRVDVKPTDPNTAIVTFSGYSSGNKAFKTTNGGTSWTNISSGLPNLPCNCVRFDAGSAIEGVYVGCDVGVYYTDNTFAGVWQPYLTALPNAPVDDLEIHAGTSKLRAATYGRGIWEVDIYNPGTLPPVAQFAPNTFITCVGSPVNFTDMSSFSPTSWSWTFPSGTPGTSTAQNPTGVTWSTPGTYTVSMTCSNANGSSSTTQVITVLGSFTPPLVEGFQTATFVPANWTANNINNDGVFWNLSTTVGAASTQCARFDNYTMDVAGARDEMWAPRLNCSTYSTMQMTFDVAYARYDATYSDSLQVLVSTDCGSTWTSVYLKGGGPVGGSNLATAPDQTATIFVPTAAQWRNETVNLNAYAGQSSVLIIFRNRGHYGQALYVDNINITGTTSAIPSATFTASSTNVCVGTPVNFTDASTNSPTSWTWTFPSGTPASATTANVTGVVWNTAGTYTVTHTATNGSGTGTTTQVITVNALPTVTTTATSTTICSGASTSMTASGAATYTWMPGSLSGATVTVTPATTTTYTVTGTSAAGCTNTATRTITVNPTPTVTATAGTPTICSGASSTLTGSGASTYTWMPGSLTGTTVTVTPASTTTYTVTGTSAAGCTSTANVTVTVNPTPTVTATAASPTICVGGSTTLTGTGASTYSWMPGSLSGTTVTVTPAVTTTYTVTGTSAAGCTNTANVTVTVSPTPTVTATATSTTICSGTSTTLTATGATTYNWMPGSLSGASVTVTPATTTTYTVTGTTGTCTSTATQLITVNASPTVTTTATSTTICSGNSTSMTASGASTYTWMPGSLSGATVTVTPAATTTYTVTGTAANGCTATSTRVITVNPTPTVTATASSTSICTGNSVTLTGSGATTYNWMPGSLTGTTVTVTPATTTTYTVTGTSTGCSSTATLTITVGPAPVVTATATSTSICSGTSTSITASGATTYTWMPGSLSGATVTVTPATTTTYTVTGTNGPLCSSTATITITVLPSPTVTTTMPGGAICSGNSKTITANGASTYAWMPGSLSGNPVTVFPAVTTTYTVTGTAANGCTGTATRTVTVNPSPTVTATASSTSICTGSSVTLSSSGASTYNWQPGNHNGQPWTTNPATTTTYTVTGTAANGCTATQTVTVTVAPPPTVTATATSTTICSGNSSTLTGNGATTYTWMPGSLSGTSVTVTPAATTTYTVTGANGTCTNTATITITVNPTPTLTAVGSPAGAICAGGTKTVTVSGASTYSWMPGSLSGSTNVLTLFTTTTYTIVGTAANGCTSTINPTFSVNPTPTVTTTASSSSVCIGSTVTLTASGASTYNWMPGSLSGSSVTDSPVTTTTYTVTGTDLNGCVGTSTQTVTVNPTPTITATASSSTICAGTTITLTASGATTYTWMPGSQNGATITDAPIVSTNYTVTGTDASGCTASTIVPVTVNALPVISATSSNSTVCSGSTVTLTGNGAVSYNWMPGSLNGSPVNDAPLTTTTYTVTGTDGNGCIGMDSITIMVNALPSVTASSSASSLCNGGSVTLTSSGATSYTWQPINLTGSSVSDTPAATTTYTVTGTDANGCVNTATVTVTINANPNISITGSANICPGDSVTLTGNGGVSYSWQPNGQTTSSITEAPSATTTYTVTGTDINGCSGTSTQTVTVGTPPGTPSIIVNGSTLTSSVTGASYQWFLNGNPIAGATSQSYTATGSGTYTVEVYDASGCGSGQSAGVVDPLGMISVDNVEFISVIPNPNNGQFSLSFHVSKADDYVIEIHDMLGQIVYSEVLNNFSGDYSKPIDLTIYGRGMYSIRLRNGDKQTIIKSITY